MLFLPEITLGLFHHDSENVLQISCTLLVWNENDDEVNNNNNNNDNLYGAVTRPYRYKGASQATRQDKP